MKYVEKSTNIGVQPSEISLAFISLAALGLSCDMRDLQSLCVDSLVVACGFSSSCGVWVQKCTGSVVALCRLSCSVARGILVPRPRIEPTFPALQGGFLTPGPPGKSQLSEISQTSA